MAKEKKIVKDKINWKKGLKLAPGYIIILLWVAFTLILKIMQRHGAPAA